MIRIRSHRHHRHERPMPWTEHAIIWLVIFAAVVTFMLAVSW